MHTDFKISAITNIYKPMFDLNNEELLSRGVIKIIVNEKPGYPCRVSLEDAEIGEEVILFAFKHHKTNSPYQSTGPLFVRKNATPFNAEINKIPKMLLHRTLSLRVYNSQGMMIDAKTIFGTKLRMTIALLFNKAEASYIQIHNAAPGCYNCQVNRVS